MKVSVRRTGHPPITIEHAEVVRYEVEDSSIEIMLLKEGGVLIRGGGLKPLVILPRASNSLIIKEVGS